MNKRFSEERNPSETAKARRINLLTRRGYWELLIKVCVAALVIVFMLTQVFLITQNEGTGMFPAMKDGDLILAYRLQRDFSKGDVIVYRVGEASYVGRVVAKGSDVVEMTENGELLVNGTPQNGEILYPTFAKEGRETVLRVSEDSLYVLGDYRQQTLDSRDFGEISLDQIQGKVITILRRRGI